MVDQGLELLGDGIMWIAWFICQLVLAVLNVLVWHNNKTYADELGYYYSPQASLTQLERLARGERWRQRYMLLCLPLFLLLGYATWEWSHMHSVLLNLGMLGCQLITLTALEFIANRKNKTWRRLNDLH